MCGRSTDAVPLTGDGVSRFLTGLNGGPWRVSLRSLPWAARPRLRIYLSERIHVMRTAHNSR